jgi:UDP-N-acetylmuramate dehydrogenase
LGRGFNGIDISAQRVVAGAAALDAQVAKRAAASGIDLTFLRTIPGAMGGAVTMNAGCYGREIRDVVKEVAGVARDGNMLRLTAAECGFSYRSSGLPEGFVITEVTLEGAKADPAELEALMHDQLAKRDASQPTKARTCGSTFRNPAGFSSTGRADDVHDLKAWKLIEGAGCRGLRVGGAQMSEMHANFMLNTGSATARDLESLGEEVRKRVFQTSGHSLEWEVKRVGENTTF